MAHIPSPREEAEKKIHQGDRGRKTLLRSNKAAHTVLKCINPYCNLVMGHLLGGIGDVDGADVVKGLRPQYLS